MEDKKHKNMFENEKEHAKTHSENERKEKISCDKGNPEERSKRRHEARNSNESTREDLSKRSTKNLSGKDQSEYEADRDYE